MTGTDVPDPTEPESTEPESTEPASTEPASTEPAPRRGRRGKIALTIGLVVVLAIVGTLGWFWKQSLVPDTYSVMSMGYPDYGRGPVPDSMAEMGGTDADGMSDMGGMHHMAGMDHEMVSVADLTGPKGPPDESITLTAREEGVELTGDDDKTVDGITLNHQSPGPLITAHQGDLLEVTLVNASVESGITLHWHGVDVPNGEDGVAGVTQDAVQQGDEYTYRFVVDDPGTYWYHSHQVSDEEVSKGLLGPLVVLPKDGPDELDDQDTLALVHTYDGNRTVNGVIGTDWVEAEPGDPVTVRVINTNDGPLRTWVTGASYLVQAIDARDLNGPEQVSAKTIVVPAGGRADLVVDAPDSGAAAVNFGGGTRLAIGPEGSSVAGGDDPQDDLDLLSYGEPEALPFDPTDADRSFTYSIGRRLAFLDGKPGFWWTINGHLYPDVPMFVVEEGDLVVMTIENHSGQVHPMHLHGHHAIVLSRDGEQASGSPWWIDSLDVEDGESYTIAFVADNPGVWMDHCHNLPHASQGLVTHLMYAGVTTPYVVGGDSDNDPE